MDTQRRIDVYTRQNQNTRLTPRQRRRMAKRAGTDPYALVIREDGMGHSLAMQGYREVAEARRSREPGRGTGRGHHTVKVILDEEPY